MESPMNFEEAVDIAPPIPPIFYYHRWVENEARRLLREGGAVNVPAMPGEVWGIVAGFLAYDEGAFSLTNLNCTSREIHQGTLPVLYETVRLKSEKAFERAIGSVNLKGFKYTKFLFVNDLTLPLLRMHQRYQAVLSGSPGPLPTDFSDVFPRLVMLAKEKPKIRNMRLNKFHPLSMYPPLNLTLYRPITFSVLMNVCTPTCDPFAKAASFFGCYTLPRELGAGHRPDEPWLGDIVSLEMRPGAYIKGPERTDLSKRHPAKEAHKFFLTVEDEAHAPGVADTLKLVLSHLKVYAGSKSVTTNPQRWVTLVIRCPASVLENYIELFRAAQPLSLAIEVYLSGISSRQEVERHLTALADAYTPHWVHRINNPGKTFVKIQSNAPAIHRRDVDDRPDYLQPLTEDHRGGYLGELVTGFNDPDHPLGGAARHRWNPMHTHGFTARMTETLLFQDKQQQEGQVISEHAYPVAHVPVLPADPHPEAPVFRLPAETSRMHWSSSLYEELAS